MRNFLLGIIATVGFVVLGQFAYSYDLLRAMGGKEPLFGPVHFIMQNGVSILIVGLIGMGIWSLFGEEIRKHISTVHRWMYRICSQR